MALAVGTTLIDADARPEAFAGDAGGEEFVLRESETGGTVQ